MRIDALYINGRIRTMDPRFPTARRIGVHHGRIVGLDAELDGVTAETVVDLGGAPVIPGFHDAHHHTTHTGMRLATLDLRPGSVRTLDELYEAVRRRAESLAPGEWLMGSGYDQNILGGHPTAEGLDRVTGGRPALLEHVSAHMSVANTAAFALAGYPGRREVPEVDGGHVVRAADGTAEGLLQENAATIVRGLTWPPTIAQMTRYLELAGGQAVRYGLTSITEPGGSGSLAGYQSAVDSGALKTRMTLMPFIEQLHELSEFTDAEDWIGIDLGLRTGFGGDRLKLGPVKIISDGSLIGRSAAMHRCYHGEPENKGFMRFAPEELKAKILSAHRAGWTVATHAIGDAAEDHALDGIEEAQRIAPRPGARHRIEHFAVAGDDQIARAAALGVVAVPQGRFISDFGDGMAAALGPERSLLCYRMKSLLAAGMVLPGSTDSPVSDANPILCIHDMVNRRTDSGLILGPDERLTAHEALRAYTYGSAYAVGEEDTKGTLVPGMLADFVVLSDDILRVASDRLREVRVGATVVGGEIVYDEAGLAC